MDSESRIEHGERTVILRASSASDVGRVRSVNQDSALVAPPAFAVLDGMGGHHDGHRASTAAAAVLRDEIGQGAPPTVDAVLAAVEAANRAALGQPDAHGVPTMSGTTLAGVVLVQSGRELPMWLVVNVGDSRVYRMTADGIAQISVDHSVVEELLREGAITPDEAARHPERHVITRALGASPAVNPDVWLMPLESGDSFLICSDGLTRELGDREIASLLREAHFSGAAPAQLLVDAALAAGGRDNVTALVVTTELLGVSGDDFPEATVDRLPHTLEETNPRA